MQNINLGDKSKFVGWKTNGVTNCLELCKMILRKYGLTNFGNSSNIYRLMYENNGKLEYYKPNGVSIRDNYRSATRCIDKHLEAGRPIIVGVNHTIGRGINEGTTDHFVVIYGREELSKYCIHYLYYEVGKGDPVNGISNENRFVYIDSDTPEFFDVNSQLKGGARFDVIQVRPNM